jgi:hypothetical protein
MTYVELQAMGMMVVGVCFGSGDMDDGITFGCFLVYLLSSSLLWISAQFKWHRHVIYNLPLEVEFPRAPDPPKGCPVR